jgi:hypothetical protein
MARLDFATLLSKANQLDDVVLEDVKNKFLDGIKRGARNMFMVSELTGLTPDEQALLPLVYVKYAKGTDNITTSKFGTIDGINVYPFSSLLPKEQYDAYQAAKHGAGGYSGKWYGDVPTVRTVSGVVLNDKQVDQLKGILEKVATSKTGLVKLYEDFNFKPSTELQKEAMREELKEELRQELLAEMQKENSNQ